MTWLEKAESQLKTHGAALRGIEAISSLVKQALENPHWNVLAVIQAIDKIADTLITGFDGKITSDEVDKHLREMVERLRSNDEAADKAIDAKFGFDHGGDA